MGNNIIFKKLFNNYNNYKEKLITSKFVPYNLIKNLIEKLPGDLFSVVELGRSVEGKSIFSIKIGRGKIKVLTWSQMHGNESTATMALFDIFNFFLSNDAFNDFREVIFSNLTMYFIPMLNPDGAEKFKRENAVGIDLNRDAIRLVSPEAKILKQQHEKIKPDFAFNLHDQANSYTVGESSTPAVISFLAPPFNENREKNFVRKKIMQVIVNINNILSGFIRGNTGKYNDEFEPRAFGDNFVKWGTSSILIETGGWKNSAGKQFQRKLNFISILAGFDSIATKSYKRQSIKDYQNIKENKKFLFDVLFKNLNYYVNDVVFKIDIGIRMDEKFDVQTKSFYYVSEIEEIGDLKRFSGYYELDCTGMFVEPGKISKENYPVNDDYLDEQLVRFYEKGITFLKANYTKNLNCYISTGINFLVGKKDTDKLEINASANFVIKLNDKIKFIVVNGFVYDLEKKEGLVKNGMIIH